MGEVPDNTILVTMDVSSLYTNIPKDEGLKAAMETFSTHLRDPNIKPKNITLVKMLEMVLTMKYFKFNGVNFLH